MSEASRYEKSAEGGFYINYRGLEKSYDSCCFAGGVPAADAPHFCTQEKIDDQWHCFVHKQPQTSHDIYIMIRAARTSEFECLRYGGTDEEILQRFVDIGLAHRVCDYPPTTSESHKLRNYCTFENTTNHEHALDDFIKSLREYLIRFPEWRRKRMKATSILNHKRGRSFSYSWTDFVNERGKKWSKNPIYHEIAMQFQAENHDGRCLITHSPTEQAGSISVSFQIHDYLEQSNECNDIRWYSRDEWNDGAPIFWRETPY